MKFLSFGAAMLSTLLAPSLADARFSDGTPPNQPELACEPLREAHDGARGIVLTMDASTCEFDSLDVLADQFALHAMRVLKSPQEKHRVHAIGIHSRLGVENMLGFKRAWLAYCTSLDGDYRLATASGFLEVYSESPELDVLKRKFLSRVLSPGYRVSLDNFYPISSGPPTAQKRECVDFSVSPTIWASMPPRN